MKMLAPPIPPLLLRGERPFFRRLAAIYFGMYDLAEWDLLQAIRSVS
jgi:hypothetical protein